ncbi:T-cell ecto-ADP-ribosyltransferase 2-like [Scomber scombrus]|uniref:T-cell ecto-ADP-ribosyltransferase 2-like n=1 Tax=Scomber scombrus TaxID=13677 RepID=UPI002DDA775A|nr:T-cell ecto-ADP-ribosyltransferase 2-like [Scomber scombrus]
MSMCSRLPLTIMLSTVPEAVDDMYEGCKGEMEKVNDKFFKKEFVGTFKEAWKHAEQCSNKQPNPEDKALTKIHMQAICAYTSNITYDEFNKAVRTGKNIYGSSFKFHYLHFWLTTAIQTLNNNQRCHITYRKNKSVFSGNVSDIIRFGSFASSSFRTNLTKYGSETCFQIETCSGAYLKDYPDSGTDEEEVLIPPYETFNITQIIEGKGEFKPLPDCKKENSLKTTISESGKLDFHIFVFLNATMKCLRVYGPHNTLTD